VPALGDRRPVDAPALARESPACGTSAGLVGAKRLNRAQVWALGVDDGCDGGECVAVERLAEGCDGCAARGRADGLEHEHEEAGERRVSARVAQPLADGGEWRPKQRRQARAHPRGDAGGGARTALR
jgi:hypothetical protein